jgi:hypothetical protein
MSTAQLDDFRGDLAFLHEREGHKGHPYWPGGSSGVTLDPGLDLGHAPEELIADVLQPHLSEDQWHAIRHVLGMKGPRAYKALRELRDLQSMRVSRELALKLLPVVAAPYWRSILKRFPPLLSAPPYVQTVLLSLAYNRGPWNTYLEVLREPIERGEWARVGAEIKGMQQDHSLQGIRNRRRIEGEYVLAEHQAEEEDVRRA